MIKKITLCSTLLCQIVSLKAQSDTTKINQFKLSGSLDAYYRYNFSDPSMPSKNNTTSFTNSQNSFELGMASAKAEHVFKNSSLTIDLGVGRRAEEFSYNDAGNPTLFLVKQAFISYSFSKNVKLTAGKWATHIGYEVIDAQSNKNYSMSYGFSYGPFFHTGVKLDINLGGKTSLMFGIADPTDFSTSNSANKASIAQISSATKDEKLKGYLNFQGSSNVTQIDLVLNATLSKKWSLNYDGTMQKVKTFGGTKKWTSNALYLNYDQNENITWALRSEYFDDKDGITSGAFMANIFATTFSINIKKDNLTFIPELRYDNSSKDIFLKSDGISTSQSTLSALFALVYKF